jgi:NAD(P)-dependent dehydrogenase (short-subunit alcohol dehydrogenase family)
MSSAPVAIVTGGTRGIGAAISRGLAARGHRLCIGFASDRERAQTLVAELEAAGAEVRAVCVDVADPAGVERLFAASDAAFGRLDVLVNNAGIVAPRARVDELDAARVERLFAVNVTGAFLCAREAVLRMSARHGGDGGSIVNVSSIAARLGSPGEYVDYAASKAAVDTMTRGLAVEVADEGIRVNAVRPGIIDTEIHASGGQPDRVERVAPSIPMRRAGLADEVAAAVLWLIGDESTYCTGTLLDVSGGR